MGGGFGISYVVKCRWMVCAPSGRLKQRWSEAWNSGGEVLGFLTGWSEGG